MFLPKTHYLASSRRFALGAVSLWSVKTRRAPSRRCRDAKVSGHTTTAMHHTIIPPPALHMEELATLLIGSSEKTIATS